MSSIFSDNGRVADAPSGNWVYRVLPRALWPYAQLARWDRPIGWQLLLLPCLWSAALAANVAMQFGHFSSSRLVWHFFLFFVGAVAMRGAGCAYNDLVDHKIDMLVARTRSRPLPSGRVTRRDTKIFIVLQALVGLAVLLSFNLFSIILGLLSLVVVAAYPFAKRVTDWPQFVLGLAFSWGALMGWSAEFANLSVAAFMLYFAAIAWTIGYDTIYAHQDREDDALIGVRSTALLFGRNTKAWLVLFYGLTALCIAIAFAVTSVAFPAWLGLLVAVVLLGWQILVLDIHDGEQCKELFKSNFTVGSVLVAGLLLAIPFA